MSKRHSNRPSISVSGKTYNRLRTAVPRGGMSKFIDKIVTSALDDQTILDRLIDRCQHEEREP